MFAFIAQDDPSSIEKKRHDRSIGIVPEGDPTRLNLRLFKDGTTNGPDSIFARVQIRINKCGFATVARVAHIL